MAVVLIGYRGSGKTTVGRLLAARLLVPFVDTDELIVQVAGRPIAAIFADDGEPAFRTRETDAIRAAVQTRGAVLSVGGGAVEAEANRALLVGFGPAIWLDAPAETLWQRMQSDAATATSRPDLVGGGLEEVRQVLERRRPIYAAMAAMVVPVAHREPAAIAAEIHGWLVRRQAMQQGQQ